MSGSRCRCETFHSQKLKHISQWLYAVDDCGDPDIFSVDELAFGSTAIDRPGFASSNQDIEMDAMAYSGSGSRRSCAANTPNAEKWESPGVMRPPDSSSPFGLEADSSPSLAQYHHDATTGRLSCPSRNGGPLRVKAHHTHSNALLFYTTTPTNRSCSHSPTSWLRTPDTTTTRTKMAAHLDDKTTTPKASSSTSGAKESVDSRPDATTSKQQATRTTRKARDIRVVTTRIAIEQAKNLDRSSMISEMSARRRVIPLPRRKAMLDGPTSTSLAKMPDETEATTLSNHNGRPRNVTMTPPKVKTRDGDGAPSRLPSRRTSKVSISSTAQSAQNSRLKRHLSSSDNAPESKKLKLDSNASSNSGANDSEVKKKYTATEPASLRRAQSLRSLVSSCSDEQPSSHIYPSPLSSQNSRPGPNEGEVPTAPNTPLPTSADYERSKANPLVRTIVFYRRTSIPSIPPVPIIAPPEEPTPTRVLCKEDEAIDRIKALLSREFSERERESLHAYDTERAIRCGAMCAANSAFSRRSTGSSSSSDNTNGQWQEPSTCSGIESQESRQVVSNTNTVVSSALRRVANRQVWSNAYGITDDFRREVTKWIFEKLPEEPVPCEQASKEKCKRPSGVDLHDQLMNSPQTRFHAAQLFHRYFLLPSKVKFWREAGKREHLEQGPDEWKRGVWDLAVACIALCVKLHRDCLPPLRPVMALEFLQLSSHTMMQETLERDMMDTFRFSLGSCTPQDVLDELWNALPTLRKATAPIRDGWAIVQRAVWTKLFAAFLEPDLLQYPVSLLTAAALIDGVTLALACHYKTEAEASVRECKAIRVLLDAEHNADNIEPTLSQIYLFEAAELVDDVVLDVRDVLEISEMALNECRTWFSCVGQEY